MRKLCRTLSPCAPTPPPAASAAASAAARASARLSRLIIAVTIMIGIAIPLAGLIAAGHRLLDQRIGGEAAVDDVVRVTLRQLDGLRAAGRPGRGIRPAGARAGRRPQGALAGGDD